MAGDEAAGFVRLRFKDVDFHAVSALGRLTHREGVGGDVSGRGDACAFEHAANDHGFARRSCGMDLHNALVGMLVTHARLALSTIAPRKSEVHTNFETSPGL